MRRPSSRKSSSCTPPMRLAKARLRRCVDAGVDMEEMHARKISVLFDRLAVGPLAEGEGFALDRISRSGLIFTIPRKIDPHVPLNPHETRLQPPNWPQLIGAVHRDVARRASLFREILKNLRFVAGRIEGTDDLKDDVSFPDMTKLQRSCLNDSHLWALLDRNLLDELLLL